MKTNFVLQTDSYKLGHYNMYPKGTTTVYSYFEARKGAKYDNTVFFSLQYLLKKYFVGRVVTQRMVNKAKAIVDVHLGEGIFNYEGWQYILDEHNGRLPLVIKAVPEGKCIPVDNVLFTVENTDPKCFWLTNYVESILSHVWYGCTVATLAKEIKDMMYKFLVKTSDNPDESINFMLHDFGFRGATSSESSAIGGAGQLLSFMGTDTVPAIELLIDYYNSDVCAYSVPATEHSIMTSCRKKGEFDIVENLLSTYDKGILSLVIDSYDYKNFVKVLGTRFKDNVLEREGKVVFRPDSGEPLGTTLTVLNLLEKYFGSTINTKGYKVLNDKVGILWGDGIDINDVRDILNYMGNKKWASSNIIFGMGGALHQKVDRDTQRCAFKSSYQVCNNRSKDIYKDPLDKSKVSKKGRLALTRNDEGYTTIERCNLPLSYDIMKEVFRDGELLIDYTLDEVKRNLNY